MSVKVSRNFGHLADLPLTSKTLMREVGLLARERVLRRTAEGKDYEGQAFASYSPGYALKKDREAGGVFGHSGYASVNLSLSGQMLQGITLVEVTDTRVELGFSS